MTVIRPNSISGITSITTLQNSIEFFKSDGSTGVNINNININSPSGIITATTFVGNLTGNVNTTSNLLLQTGGTERVRITNGGQFHIGNATNNANNNALFKAVADDGEAADLYVGQFVNLEATAGQSYGVNIQAGSNSTDHGFRVRNRDNNITQFIVRGDGNVGINQNAPRSKLEVVETHDTTGAGTFTPVLRLSTTYYGVEQGPQIQFGTTNVSYPQWIYGDICAGYEGGSFGGALIFRTNSGSSMTAVSERGRWTRDGHLNITDGNLVVASGHGIDFSANAGSSATGSSTSSQLLDDYEEGTCTLTLESDANNTNTNGTGATDLAITGSYVKIGKMVTVTGLFSNLHVAGSSTDRRGHVFKRVRGLPFTAYNGTGQSAYTAALGYSRGVYGRYSTAVSPSNLVLYFFLNGGQSIAYTQGSRTDIVSTAYMALRNTTSDMYMQFQLTYPTT